ncbi:MAG: hypothetical protein CK427_03595 [Leptospira sp.]|nr:MAG: hypothetical protein CK427_03595 [Leptospira sp.]
MLKDRLVFTRKGWSVYNSEFIFDTLSFLLFFSLQIGLVYFGFIDSLLSLASIFIPYMGFFIIHKITKKYIYLFGLLIHLLFLQFVIPVQWMNPLWIFVSCTIGLGLFSIFQHYFAIRFPYFFLPLLILFLFSKFFKLEGMSIDLALFPWKEIESWTGLDYVGLFGLNQFSLLESFSIYALSLSALFIFRRFISILALFWIMIISIIPYFNDIDSIPWLTIASHANIFFFACLLPGRSFYSSFWIHQFSWFILLILQIGIVFFELPDQTLGFLLFLFFMVEGFFLKFFHASIPMKGKNQ